MRTVNFLIFALFLISTSVFTDLTAQNKISIQSTLKDISGKAIPDGDVSVTFRLYHQMEQGQAQWSENTTVSVVGGIYSHKLGSVTTLPPSIFGSTLYLGVTVSGGQELAPRTELTSAPYAVSVGALAANGGSASFEQGGLFSLSGGAKTGGFLGIATSTIPYHLSIAGNHGLHRYNDRLALINSGNARMQLWDDGNTSFDVQENKGISFWVNNNQRLRIENDGIVTTGYHAVYGDLSINNNNGNFNMIGSGNINMNGGNLHVSNGNNASNVTRWVTIGDNDTGLRSSADGVLQVVTDGNPTLHLSDGRLGVNNESPQAGLHVSFPFGNQNEFQGYSFNYTGLSHFNEGGMHFYNNSNTNQPLGGPEGNELFQVAAIFDGSVVSYKGIWSAQNLQFSDKRIKNIKGQSNSSKDLSLLNAIKITDYTMIDKVQDKNTYKKVVAQEIQEIYPQSVIKTRNVIPNIMAQAVSTKFTNKTLTITLNEGHNLAIGDHIDVLSKEQKLTDVEVFMIIDAKTFVINTETDLTQIFVYGKYVDDFLSVDYDALSMLNISATQELHKRLIALEAENTALKTSSAKLEDRLEKIEAMLSDNDIKEEGTKSLAKK